jgi:hypothetical protein
MKTQKWLMLLAIIALTANSPFFSFIAKADLTSVTLGISGASNYNPNALLYSPDGTTNGTQTLFAYANYFMSADTLSYNVTLTVYNYTANSTYWKTLNFAHAFSGSNAQENGTVALFDNSLRNAQLNCIFAYVLSDTKITTGYFEADLWQINMTSNVCTLLNSQRTEARSGAGNIGYSITYGNSVYTNGKMVFSIIINDNGFKYLIINSETDTISYRTDVGNTGTVYMCFGAYETTDYSTIKYGTFGTGWGAVWEYSVTLNSITFRGETTFSTVMLRGYNTQLGYVSLAKAENLQSYGTYAITYVPLTYGSPYVSAYVVVSAEDTSISLDYTFYQLDKQCYEADAIQYVSSDYTATYWFEPTSANMVIANYSYSQKSIQLNAFTLPTPATDQTYIYGYAYATLTPAIHTITIYFTTTIPTSPTGTVPTTPTVGNNPDAGSPQFSNAWIGIITGSLMLPLLLLFVPAMIMGLYLGGVGFISGLAVGATIMGLAGLLPFWAILMIGLAIFILLWKGNIGMRNEAE